MRARFAPLWRVSLALSVTRLADRSYSVASRTAPSALAAVVAAYAARGVTGTTLVARDGQVLFRWATGPADRQAGIQNTPITQFRLGSLSKQFTAAAVLLLEQQGRLRISDGVQVYLKDAPPAWRDVTIRNLLTHTSGIPDYVDTDSFTIIKGKHWTPAELTGTFRDKPLEFAPGTRESYSSSNYVLLGRIIESVTGETYAAFLREQFFQPLGMLATGSGPTDTATRLAHGYDHLGGRFVASDSVDLSSTFGAGSMFSTVDDLLRWESGLFGGRVLGASALRTMTTPFIGDYACGLHRNIIRGHLAVFHSGRIDGFSAFMAYYPADRITIIVLSNVYNREMANFAADLAGVIVRP